MVKFFVFFDIVVNRIISPVDPNQFAGFVFDLFTHGIFIVQTGC